MVLHWAVNAWNEPDRSLWPENTHAVDGKAVQTRFRDGAHVQIVIPEDKCPNRYNLKSNQQTFYLEYCSGKERMMISLSDTVR